MKKVFTKLTDEQLFAIAKYNMTPYSFLQRAVEEKLANDGLEKRFSALAMAISERLGRSEATLVGAIGQYKEDAVGVLQKTANI
jgi:hypothetical protein